MFKGSGFGRSGRDRIQELLPEPGPSTTANIATEEATTPVSNQHLRLGFGGCSEPACLQKHVKVWILEQVLSPLSISRLSSNWLLPSYDDLLVGLHESYLDIFFPTPFMTPAGPAPSQHETQLNTKLEGRRPRAGDERNLRIF